MTAILGLNAFHPDSSACLVLDGKLSGAVSEERLGPREKHSQAFPVHSIRWLLKNAGINLADVTHVAIARDAKANWGSKLRHLAASPGNALNGVSRFVHRHNRTSKTIRNLPDLCNEDPEKCRFTVHAVEHHIAHIASSYFLSPFDGPTVGFSYDGSGDFASAMHARCTGNKIEVLDRVLLPTSLGHFYTAMCQFIGFERFGEEYKVMGLAPYGEDTYSEIMSEVLTLEGQDWFKLNSRYFNLARGFTKATVTEEGAINLGQIYTSLLGEKLGPARSRNHPITTREMNIAKSTQVRFEQASMNCMRTLERLSGLDQLAIAGGCALNGVMNARMLRETRFQRVYHQPASSDDGTAIGAAYHCWHSRLNKDARFEMKHSFWGPEYSSNQIRRAIDGVGLRYMELSESAHLVQTAANFIANGAVLGWYQGRSEWGPRALGNRSILANPAISNMKEIINCKIKRRESFRPFAPSVLKEDIGTYFEQDVNTPFMMHVLKFKTKWQRRFPAVTHVDGTGRVQSVCKTDNQLFYSLISAIKDITGFGMVLNTSFNENEPVVDTPAQAIATFSRTDMDVLVLGNFILVKDDRPPTEDTKQKGQ